MELQSSESPHVTTVKSVGFPPGEYSKVATVPSNGSTNQSAFGFEEMLSTFLLSMFEARGVFAP
jgi:hypothetical protein